MYYVDKAFDRFVLLSFYNLTFIYFGEYELPFIYLFMWILFIKSFY